MSRWRKSNNGHQPSHASGGSPPVPPPRSQSASSFAIMAKQQPPLDPEVVKHTSSPIDTMRPSLSTSLTHDNADGDGDDDDDDAKCRRLLQYVEKMRRAPLDADQAEQTYFVYGAMREECSRLCRGLLNACLQQSGGEGEGDGSTSSGADPTTERLSIGPRTSAVCLSAVCLVDGSLSFGIVADESPPSLMPHPIRTTVGSNGSRNGHPRELYLVAIRHWQSCQVALLEALRTSLLEIYQGADPAGATVRGFEMLCASRSARHTAVKQIRRSAAAASGGGITSYVQHNFGPLFAAPASADLSVAPTDDGADFLTGYEIRFSHYDILLADLGETHRLLNAAELGLQHTTAAADVRECVISPRGNVVLEFVNSGGGVAEDAPVYRFRVSSHMLAEVSPVFASIFALYSGTTGGGGVYAGGGGSSKHSTTPATTTTTVASSLEASGGYEKIQLPPPPIRHTCSDGTTVDLYQMPQTEPNTKRAMEIVLHAAHMHNEEIPRDVDFDQFVAVASVCLRYRCTSPLELIVEHRWLPQWMHRTATTLGAGDVPDGLLLISYAFGVRRLFTRVSKSAVLNVVDEADLRAKNWPRAIKDKIWAVRQAKVEQVYACCSGALQEYLRPPPLLPPKRPPTPPPLVLPPFSPSASNNNGGEKSNRGDSRRDGKSSRNSGGAMAGTTSAGMSRGTGDGSDSNGGSGSVRTCVFEPTSAPRCPKGSHACDAASLGWLMKTFAELQVLPHIVQSASIVGHLPPPPKRSLNQLFDSLRL